MGLPPRVSAFYLTILHYDADAMLEKPLHRVEEALPLLKPDTTTWININGIHDTAFIR